MLRFVPTAGGGEMIEFKNGWNAEIPQYANRYGTYKVFLESFDENSISAALFGAQGHFSNVWVKNLIKIAMDPFDPKVVLVEQGTHQVEDTFGGGFCLHFTARDPDGFAFHFYINQSKTGLPQIMQVTYMQKGWPVVCNRF